MRKASVATEVARTRNNRELMEKMRIGFKHKYTLIDLEHEVIMQYDVVGGPWRYDAFINGTKIKGRKHQWRNSNVFENLRMSDVNRFIMYDVAEAVYNYQKLEYNPTTDEYEITRVYVTGDDNNIDMEATKEMEQFIDENVRGYAL